MHVVPRACALLRMRNDSAILKAVAAPLQAEDASTYVDLAYSSPNSGLTILFERRSLAVGLICGRGLFSFHTEHPHCARSHIYLPLYVV